MAAKAHGKRGCCCISKILNTHLLPNSSNLSFSSTFFRNPINCPCALTCFVLAYLAPVALPNPLRTTPPETCVPSPNHPPPTTHHVFSFECCRLTLNSVNQHLHILPLDPPHHHPLFTFLPLTRFTTTTLRTFIPQSLTPIELCSTANQSSPANNALIPTDP